MRTTRIFTRFGALVLALAFGAVQAQEDYATWASYKTVVVNTKTSGAGVTANLLNYPLLVRLDSTAGDVFLQGGTGGASIRFAKPSGGKRPYQIESWDSAGKKAAIWVLADSIKGNDSVTALRLYFGKTGAVDSSRSRSVFDTTNGFRAVWHLGESASPSNDATALATPATWMNTPASAPGLIGNAINFANPNGTSAANAKYLTAAYNVSNNNFKTNGTNGLTISAWVNRTTNNGQAEQGIAGRYNWNGARRQVFVAARNSGNQWRLFRSTDGVAETDFGKSTVTDGQWTLITATVKNGQQVLYVNGVADSAQNTATIGSLDSVWSAAPFLIGRMETNGCCMQGINALIDEVRFDNLTRSADWIKLDYQTQKPGAVAVTIKAGAATTAPTSLVYSPDSAAFGLGVAVNLVPTLSGGAADSFTVAPALPDSLRLNKLTGAITGYGRAASPLTSYVITATNSFGTAKDTLRLALVAVAPTNLVYPSQAASYLSGAPVPPNVPTVTGLVDSFTVSPALPTGLTLNKSTGVISGKPASTSAATNYTVSAVNSAGSAKDTVNITVTASSADAAYSSWSNHKVVVINTRAAGAPASLRNFPLLVRLDSTNFLAGFGQAAYGGADLRFTKPGDAVRLPHQIESWDAVAKRAAVWVLVDSVRGDNVTNIRMHWGKAGVADSSKGSAVFATTNGFGAVYHMNEASGDVLDATANANTGTNVRTTSTAGLIGPARNFGGGNSNNNAAAEATAQYITLGNPASLDLGTGRVTLEAWVRWTRIRPTAGSSYWRNIIMRLSGSDELHLRIEGNTPYGYRAGAYLSSTDYGSLSPQSAASYGDSAQWVHLTGVYDSASASGNIWRLYRNGVLLGESGEGDPGATGTGDWVLGAFASTAQRRYFVGDMDEVRISRTHRSASWIKLSYETQKAVPAGISLSDTLMPPLSLTRQARIAGGSLSARATSQGVFFRVQSAGAVSVRLSVLDLRGREVWAHSVSGSGEQNVHWDGRAVSGAFASSGVYTVRAVLMDARGKVTARLERSLPLVR